MQYLQKFCNENLFRKTKRMLVEVRSGGNFEIKETISFFKFAVSDRQ